MWISSAYLIYSSRIENLKQAHIENEKLADALSAYTSLVFSSIESRLKDTAKYFSTKPPLKPLDPEITELLGEWVKDTKGIFSLNLFSEEGTLNQSAILSDTGEIYVPKKKLNFRERQYFKYFADDWKTEKQDELYISNPVRSKVTNRWAVPIVYPRQGPEDKFYGLVVTILQVQNFMEFFTRSEINQDQTVAIANTNGIMMLRIPRAEGIVGKDFSHGVLYTKHLKASPNGSYEAKVVTEGTERLVTYRKLEDFPLIVVVSKLKQNILSEWWKQSIISLIFAGIISIFLGYFLRIILRQATVLEGHEDNLRQQVNDRTQELQSALLVAQRISKSKSEFLATVSHELRTPLTSIKGSLGLLNEGILGALPDKAKGMVDIANKNTDRLIFLVNDILDVEKFMSGKVKLDIQPIDISDLVQRAIEENQGYAIENKVKFVFNQPPTNLKVSGDPYRLTQVIANLLSNAAKFSFDNSDVEVSITLNNNHARISVADTGPGIPEEFHDQVFEKFAQADKSDSRQKDSTGLGLSISQAIIEKHGGQIDFETKKDVGTTFFFELEIVQ
ncbi:MAG: ATP-binding protein [Rhodospirillales bacterium]|nr:ATP-binding protein [Rhodospirillales bacterium]